MILRPKHLHLLAGASGSGKTRLVLQMLGAWASENKSFPIKITASKVLMLTTDRFDEELPIYLKQLGADKKVTLHQTAEMPEFRRLRSADAYRIAVSRLLTAHTDHDFGVIDTLGPLIGGNIIDYNNVRYQLQVLQDIARECGTTLLLVHHAPKLKKADYYVRYRDRSLGSMAFQGYTDSQSILLDKYETADQEYHILDLCPHNAPEEQYELDLSTGWFTVVRRMV